VYNDVEPSAWYAEAVRYVTENSLMNGTGGGAFSPETRMTRAMLVTVLYRYAGQPAMSSAAPFSDIETGQWYTAAIAWAAGDGVVNGYADGRFGTNDHVTREQIASILYRYAERSGRSTSGASELTAYSDARAVSAYALDAVRWANANGLMQGRSASELAPGGDASRAEVATLIMRYIENIVKGA
jgi:hypothetical protein